MIRTITSVELGSVDRLHSNWRHNLQIRLPTRVWICCRWNLIAIFQDFCAVRIANRRTCSFEPASTALAVLITFSAQRLRTESVGDALQYQVFDVASRGDLVAHHGADFVIGLALVGVGGGVGLEIGDRLKVPKR